MKASSHSRHQTKQPIKTEYNQGFIARIANCSLFLVHTQKALLHLDSLVRKKYAPMADSKMIVGAAVVCCCNCCFLLLLKW